MQANAFADLWTGVEALPAWQGFLLVVGVSVLVAKVVQVGGDVAVRRLTRRIPGEIDDVVFAHVHPPLYVSVVLVGAVAAVGLLGIAPETVGTLRAGTLTLLTLAWAFALVRMGRAISREATDADGIDGQVVPIFQNVWTALLVGVSVFLVLSYWRVDVTPLLASAGVIGIVVGFAARDTIANFFGSIALYSDGTYRVGDYIVLESGERGRVEDISIRSTVVRTRDDTLVTVPNSVLNTATIVNESTPERDRRVRLPVGVAYGTDADHVESTLLAVADGEPLVLDSPAPRVRFRGFGDSALDVELLCWISDPVLRGRASHRLTKAVYGAFRREGIEIPFPQRVVTMGGADTDDTPSPPDGLRPADERTGSGHVTADGVSGPTDD